MKEQPNILCISKFHSQAYHMSHLLDFTVKLNEILNQKEKEERLFPQTEGLDCIITDLKQSGLYYMCMKK